MIHNTYMPLRTTVGASVPLANVQVTGYAPELEGYEILASALNTPPTIYSKFHPMTLVSADAELGPGSGVATLPAPGELPAFLDTVMRGPFDLRHFVRIAAVGPQVTSNTQSKLWVELELTFPGKKTCPLIGGIFYGGYPVLPYYITPYGANSSNYGLPREIRVSWDGHMGAGFLDDEMAIVQQETTSHNGVHVLATGPVRAEKLRIRLADFPTIIQQVEVSGEQEIMTEFWGFLIPYLGVFAYQEDVRFAPPVPAGLLAAYRAPIQTSGGYFSTARLNVDQSSKIAATAADEVFATIDPKEYFPLSAASLFHSGRNYRIHIEGRDETMQECFISGKLERGDQMRIYFSQTEEHRRCLGGLTLAGVEDKIVRWFAQDEHGEFDLGVYELDPLEGVSPIAPERDPSKDKYTTLIYRRQGLSFAKPELKCSFLRPTMARCLAAVFTCTKPGRLAMQSLRLVQSAHVQVSPRPARSQQLRQVHFRLVGPHLADDYARLGKEGFKFSIEHVVGGEVKDVLFEARTLSDLLQLSGVRLYANQRYLETTTDVSRETGETLPDSYEHRYTQSGSHGWRRSQSGSGVEWSPVSSPIHLQDYAHDPGNGTFATRSNAETRSKTEHLGFLAGADSLVNTLNAVEALLGLPANTIASVPPANALTSGAGWGGNQAWAGLPAQAQGGISGLLNLSTPPIDFPSTIYQNLMNIFSNPASAATDLPALIAGLNLGAFLVFNGVSVGISPSGSINVGGVGVGMGGSLTTSQLLPTVTRTSATGSTGSISYQATKTGKSYSQSLNDGYDEAESFTEYRRSVNKRLLTRELLQPGTVRSRTAGVHVQFHEQVMDVVAGSIPLSLHLPALAEKVYQQRDEWVRIRFGNGMRDGLRPNRLPAQREKELCGGANDLVMDVWFDLREEVVRDDY